MSRRRPTFDCKARLAAAENRRAEVEAAAARLSLAMKHVVPHLGGGRWRFTLDGRIVAVWAPADSAVRGAASGRPPIDRCLGVRCR